MDVKIQSRSERLNDARRAVGDDDVTTRCSSHATTSGCAALLDELLAEDASRSVLDVGTGTGILAMLADQLGAGPILAVDIDPDAVALAKARADLGEALARASAEVRRECGEGTEADRIVAAAVAALRVRPPPGFGVAEIEGFAGRHRERLRGIVEGALIQQRAS